MAWIAVDKDKREYVSLYKPIRCNTSWLYDGDFVQLPQGSIQKLIGRSLTWDDNPVEIK